MSNVLTWNKPENIYHSHCNGIYFLVCFRLKHLTYVSLCFCDHSENGIYFLVCFRLKHLTYVSLKQTRKYIPFSLWSQKHRLTYVKCFNLKQTRKYIPFSLWSQNFLFFSGWNIWHMLVYVSVITVRMVYIFWFVSG
jgi:hypothetical protein